MTNSNLTKIAELSTRVENTVGKGKSARYEQFLLFPQCFQKACFPGASKGIIVWEWVKSFADNKSKGAQIMSLSFQKKNIGGKGENASRHSICQIFQAIF